MSAAVAVGSYIPVAVAARILGRSSRQVHRYIEEGLLRHRRAGPRGWKRVSYEDVCRLCREQTEERR